VEELLEVDVARSFGNMLVVAPATIVQQWVQEVESARLAALQAQLARGCAALVDLNRT